MYDIMVSVLHEPFEHVDEHGNHLGDISIVIIYRLDGEPLPDDVILKMNSEPVELEHVYLTVYALVDPTIFIAGRDYDFELIVDGNSSKGRLRIPYEINIIDSPQNSRTIRWATQGNNIMQWFFYWGYDSEFINRSGYHRRINARVNEYRYPSYLITENQSYFFCGVQNHNYDTDGRVVFFNYGWADYRWDAFVDYNAINRSIQTKIVRNFPVVFNIEISNRSDIPRETGTLTIHCSITGRIIRSLRFNLPFDSMPWDATDDEGNPVLSGVYLYRVYVDGHADEVGKMILMR